MLRAVRAWLFGAEAERRPTEAPATSAEAPRDEPPDETPPPAEASESADVAVRSTDAERDWSANEATESTAVAARQERAAERLLEDERLRGDLTDDEVQPLLDWALAQSDALAARTAGLADEQAERVIDDGLARIKDAMQAAGGAVLAMADSGAEARNAELARLPDSIGPPLVGEERQAEVRSTLADALAPVTRDPDLAGSDLAAAVAEALRATLQTTREEGGPSA